MAIKYLFKNTETEFSTAYIDTESDPTTIIVSQYSGQSISKSVSNHTSGQLEGDGYEEITEGEFEEQTLRIGTHPTRPF